MSSLPEGVKEAFYGWYDLIAERGIAEVAAAISKQAVITKAELIALYLLGTTEVAWAEVDRAWQDEPFSLHMVGSAQSLEGRSEL